MCKSFSSKRWGMCVVNVTTLTELNPASLVATAARKWTVLVDAVLARRLRIKVHRTLRSGVTSVCRCYFAVRVMSAVSRTRSFRQAHGETASQCIAFVEAMLRKLLQRTLAWIQGGVFSLPHQKRRFVLHRDRRVSNKKQMRTSESLEYT